MSQANLEALARFLGSHAIGTLVAALAAAFGVVALAIWIFHAAARPVWHLIRRWWPLGSARANGMSDAQTGSYLGLHLALGLGMALVAIRLFGALAEAVVEQGKLTRFDSAFAAALHDNATLPKLVIFKDVAMLANIGMLLFLAASVTGGLLVRRQYLRAAAWFTALAGGGLLNMFLKDVFQRLRPSLPNPFVTEHGWSFPSGHAMGSTIAYGMLAYLLTTEIRSVRIKRIIIGIAVFLVIIIGFSRLYLTVHYFSDVVAGYLAGGFWLLVCITGTELARRGRRRDA